jgi:hypothetical protein
MRKNTSLAPHVAADAESIIIKRTVSSIVFESSETNGKLKLQRLSEKSLGEITMRDRGSF